MPFQDLQMQKKGKALGVFFTYLFLKPINTIVGLVLDPQTISKPKMIFLPFILSCPHQRSTVSDPLTQSQQGTVCGKGGFTA